jgi:predicted amidohydrolase YtcJ
MTRYRNGRIFTTAEPAWAESMVVDDGVLTFVGDDAAAEAAAPDAETVDLNGAFGMPPFVIMPFAISSSRAAR